MIAPIIDELAHDYQGKAKITKLDVDKCRAWLPSSAYRTSRRSWSFIRARRYTAWSGPSERASTLP